MIRDLITSLIEHYPGTAPSTFYRLGAVKPYVQGHRPEENIYGKQYESVWLDKAEGDGRSPRLPVPCYAYLSPKLEGGSGKEGRTRLR